jgi:hypothetical protein
LGYAVNVEKLALFLTFIRQAIVGRAELPDAKLA